jgi:hypothetical protein
VSGVPCLDQLQCLDVLPRVLVRSCWNLMKGVRHYEQRGAGCRKHGRFDPQFMERT